MISLKCILLFFFFCFVNGQNGNKPLVTVAEGQVKGLVEKLLDNTPYYSFKGMPYARPPVGNLRFTAPQPLQPWQGIRDATKYGPVCPQYDVIADKVIEGSEDCLSLNVYTRTINVESKKPVMVYIHGGAYMSGSGSDSDLGPEFLLQHDVILVTLNYRLEVLGFLSLDTPEVPGNVGMKDQVAALKWVKKNIRKFGGDPDNITLFGESSGASSVTYHMLSPMSKGLFQKAIVQSGVAIVDWALGQGAKERAFRAGRMLGKDTNDTTELLEFFRSLPATKLASKITYGTMTEDETHRGLKMHFVPVVEKKFEHVDAFLTQKPIDLLVQNKVHKMPLLIGYNSAEGLINLIDELGKVNFTNANPQYLVPREIAGKVSEPKTKEFGRRIKDFYVGDLDFGNETATDLVSVFSDLHFIYSTHRFVHFFSSCNEPLYMYRFNLDTDLNLFKLSYGLGDMEGACHADDLFYLFHGGLNADIYKGQERLQDIVYRYTKLWTDFAKTGNPTPKGSSVQWPKYNKDQRRFFNIDETYLSGKFAEKDRVEFMDSIYCEAGLHCINQVHSSSSSSSEEE